MSLSGVQFFIYRLKSDEALRDSLMRPSDATFEGFELEADEKAALKSGDLAGLFRNGYPPSLVGALFAGHGHSPPPPSGIAGAPQGNQDTQQLRRGVWRRQGVKLGTITYSAAMSHAPGMATAPDAAPASQRDRFFAGRR